MNIKPLISSFQQHHSSGSIRRRDEAFTLLSDHFLDSLKRLLPRVTLRHENVDDVKQDLNIVLFDLLQAPDLLTTMDNPGGYIYKTLENTLLNKRKLIAKEDGVISDWPSDDDDNLVPDGQIQPVDFEPVPTRFDKVEIELPVIKVLWDKGYKQYEIAKLLKIDNASILYRLQKLGISADERARRCKHPIVTVSETVLEELTYLYTWGWGTPNLCDAYEIKSVNVLKRILRKNGVTIRSYLCGRI